MASSIRDLRSLTLFEIIGAPLAAMVQAEAQATRATVEYIKEVGFLGGDEEGGDELGDLRLARFAYNKPDESGDPATFEAEVPVLSLVPIPGIRIRDARVAFTVKINDAYTENTSTSTGGGGGAGGWLKPALTQFRGSLSAKSKGDAEVRGAYELDIEINLEQMPVAPGLEKLLTTFDQAINEKQKDGES